MNKKTIAVSQNKLGNEPAYRSESNWAIKTFEVPDLKIFDDQTGFYLTGYANTKNKPDSYGDIPTNFNGKPVYDLSRFFKNPVMQMNHDMSPASTMGIFTELREDEIGLWFKSRLVDLDDCFNQNVKHVISLYRKGFLRAISIGGRWFFDDPKNPSHLTRAYIYEISGVAIPADEDALCGNVPMPKSISAEETEEKTAEVDKSNGQMSIKLAILKAKTKVNIWKGYRKNELN